MKKVLLLILMAVIMVLAGCQKEAVSADVRADTVGGNNAEYEDNTVVDRHGEVTNEERFNGFLTNLSLGKADQIKITVFTTEGDPIFRELAYDGKEIHSVLDTTKDKYGSGQIVKMVCETIKEVKAADRTEFVLSGCDKTAEDTLVLVKWK